MAVQRIINFHRSVSLTRAFAIKTNTSLFSTSIPQETLDDELKLEYLDGEQKGIAIMSINRPAAKNSLSKNIVRLFENHMDKLSTDTNLRSVILRSGVPGVFCAGADLKERKKMTDAEVPVLVKKGRMLFHRLSRIPVPTICALDGVALGGGLELSLTCDFRVASTSAKLGLPETKLAIIPGGGGTVRLPRLVGISKAKELIFTGKVINSEDAESIGLVDYSVEQNKNGDAAYLKSLELAEQIISQGPIALKMAKKSINEGSDVGIDAALIIEGNCYANVIPTKDRREALQAFAEKRKPVFYGS